MAGPSPMQRLARWHIWLGWIVGLPILMWTVTGLVMVARPIEEVRGEHLRIKVPEEVLPPDSEIAFAVPTDTPVKSITAAMEQGKVVTQLELADGTIRRYGEDGAELPQLSGPAAMMVVAREIVGGTTASNPVLFAKGKAPIDFRRDMAVWQVTLDDGTHVYVGQQSGRIEAVRTRWWRAFDFMWGLHILDPVEREDTSHPLLILAAALSMIGAMMGCVLLFRRRKSAR